MRWSAVPDQIKLVIKNGAAAGEAECVEDLPEDRQEEYRQLAAGVPLQRRWQPVKYVIALDVISSQSCRTFPIRFASLTSSVLPMLPCGTC